MSGGTSFDVVRIYDPEVEAHAEPGAVFDYRHHRDLGKLGLPPEARPVVFRCHALTRDQRRMTQALGSEHQRWEMAFRLGVRSVVNLPSSSGLRDVVPARDRENGPIRDESLDQMGLGDHDIYEVGHVVYERSFLALGVPLWCPSLDSSERAWVSVAASRRVEQKTAPETTGAESSSSASFNEE